jgi:hypothetical protein
MTYFEWSVLAQFGLNGGLGLIALCLFCRDMLGGVSVSVPAGTTEVATSKSGRWQLAILGAMAFCVMLGEGAMADWTAVFLSSEFKVGDSVAAIGYAMFAICMASGRLLGDWFTKILGITAQIRLCGVLAMTGIILAVVSTSPIQSIIGFGMIGAGFSTIVPIIFTMSGRVANMSSSAALATVSSIGYFGLLLGPPAIGFAAELTNLRWSLMLVFIATLISVVLTFMLNGYSSLLGRGTTTSDLSPVSVPVDAMTPELALDSTSRLTA